MSGLRRGAKRALTPNCDYSTQHGEALHRGWVRHCPLAIAPPLRQLALFGPELLLYTTLL